jgi:hypothetical protein
LFKNSHIFELIETTESKRAKEGNEIKKKSDHLGVCGTLQVQLFTAGHSKSYK